MWKLGVANQWRDHEGQPDEYCAYDVSDWNAKKGRV